ncbi:MAG: NUDIX domain-containing protein [bacterium]|nr:NUDIX domain-containing protein [bacterium]
MKVRVRAIIIQDNSLLLIHRIKEDKEYWVFPGGGVEEGESEKEALIREAREELGLDVAVVSQFASNDLQPIGSLPAQREVFYFCVITGGRLGSGTGTEFSPNNTKGTYNLEWISLDKISMYNILPDEIKVRLLKERSVI